MTSRWSRCCIELRARRRRRMSARCLRILAQRAEDYYRSAEALLPFIDRESRPALWVLVAVYHALLKRIERADYDVFSRRAIGAAAAEAGDSGRGSDAHDWARLVA